MDRRERGCQVLASAYERANRGLQDILIAVVDGLKRFPEATTAAFPEAMVQTCPRHGLSDQWRSHGSMHLIRHSLSCCSWKDRKAVAAGLRRIYSAPTAAMAGAGPDAFGEKRARKSASIAPAWRMAWQEVIPFFGFDPAIRRIICTTNAIESLNRIRRENSPPDCFLTLRIPQIHQDPRVIPDRRGGDKADLPGHPQLRERRPERPEWFAARNQFAIMSGEQFDA